MKPNELSRYFRTFGRPLALGCCAVLLSACPPPGTGTPDPMGGEGQGVPQLILDYEMDAFDALNDERTTRSITALTMDNALRLVARGHSEDMAARDFFAHENPDGLDAFERMANAGITYSTAGENIAWNNFPDPVAQAVTGWMNSTGHRNNILNAEFTLTGMGVAGDGSGGYYFTQVFTRPRAKTLHGEEDLDFVTWYLPPPIAIE